MKLLRIVIISLILFPLSAYAEEASVYLKCPETIIKGEEFTCEVRAKSPYEVSGIDYRFRLKDNLEKVDFIVDPIWVGNEEDDIVLVYTDKNKINDFPIGKIVLKAEEDLNKVEVFTTKLLFSDASFNEHILVDEVVNKMESKKENEVDEQHNYFDYVIILVIIGVLVLPFILIIKKIKK